MINPTDYIPHGIVTAFAGVVAYVFRDHAKRDDARFNGIKDYLLKIEGRQTEVSDKMAENHAEILKLLIRKD